MIRDIVSPVKALAMQTQNRIIAMKASKITKQYKI
jgi:hypothetical protein